MNINILGTKVHVALVFFGALCVLMLFGCIGVISWGGWKMNQQDEAVADLGNQTKNLKTENEGLKGETDNLRSQIKNLNETSQKETENLNQRIQSIQKYKAFLFNENCNNKECLLCLTGWIFFNDSCYLFGYVSLSWDHSRLFCQDKSADLVVINNQQEQEFIYNNIYTNCWLGLQRVGSNWVWIDGRIDSLGFWRSSNPNSTHSYAYMYQSGNPTASWFITSSSNTFYVICEQKAFKVSLN